MKLWVDDERDAPDNTWVVARSYEAALSVLHVADVVSLDHDLGEEKTGYDLVCQIEMQAAGYFGKVPEVRCHSANPVGRKRIEQAVEAMRRRRADLSYSSTSQTVVFREAR